VRDLTPRQIVDEFDRRFVGRDAVPPAWGQGHRRSAAFILALAMAFAPSVLVQMASAATPADRIREMERLIDAVASRNEAPKLVGKRGLAYPAFPDKFDWKDQKRVRAAVWALAQDDSNDLFGHLVEHFHDKRYSATCELDECYPDNWDVGDICEVIGRNKLLCAYLRHLKPGGTAHYGGPTSNFVPEGSRKYLPGKLQSELHYRSHLDDTDGLAKWCHARKGKPLYELQIEVCEWAIKKVQDAHGVAEKPKEEFIAAVKKEIESLKKNKKPVVDPSRWSSPMSDGYWKFYTKEDAVWTRDTVLKQESQADRKP
jgi:hypothetical protein